jgi:hypothetical protein
MILTAVFVQAASAGTVTSYDRNAFQAAVASATLSGQNFDSLPLGTITTVDGVTYTPSDGTALVTSSYLTTTGSHGLGSTSAGYFLPSETLTLTFAAPITAFAIDINTFATANGSYQAAINDGSDSIVPSLYDVFPNESTGQFLGFVDTTSFNTVVISSLGGFSYTVDTLAYGSAASVIAQAVPEPSTWALFALGLSMMATSLFRRRKP